MDDLEPMRVPFPLKQAPKARANASGSIVMPSTECTICPRTRTRTRIHAAAAAAQA